MSEVTGMNDQYSKKRDRLISIIGGSLGILLILALPIWTIVTRSVIQADVTTDYTEYATEAYRERDGGEAAASYLPTEDTISDATHILYRHFDMSKKRAWGLSLADLFSISVTYSPENYESKKHEWFSLYFKGDTSEKDTALLMLQNGEFDACIRLSYQTVDQNRYDVFYMLLDASAHTIHFCFFPSAEHIDSDISSIIDRHYAALFVTE